MLRIALFLSIALASCAVVAHEANMGGTGSGDCPDGSSAAREQESPAAPDNSGSTGSDAKLTPDLHGDVPAGRSQSTRWHSFLPGMFR